MLGDFIPESGAISIGIRTYWLKPARHLRRARPLLLPMHVFRALLRGVARWPRNVMKAVRLLFYGV
jgi:hypothetical protein